MRHFDLVGAKLRDLDLHGADLSRSKLDKADLRGANLAGVSLYNASLTGADLRGAILDQADLRHADLEGAKRDARTSLQGIQVEDDYYFQRWNPNRDQLPALIQDVVLARYPVALSETGNPSDAAQRAFAFAVGTLQWNGLLHFGSMKLTSDGLERNREHERDPRRAVKARAYEDMLLAAKAWRAEHPKKRKRATAARW